MAILRAAVAASLSARSLAPLVRFGSTDSAGLSGLGALGAGGGGTAAANAVAALYIESRRKPTDSATWPMRSPASASFIAARCAASPDAPSHRPSSTRPTPMRCSWKILAMVVDVLAQLVTRSHRADLSMLLAAW
ncbi:hypothetical protein AWN90_09480 [Nocardia terpenica]|uniref:Uncharacterized protein n=1 Tax=Nocardia terpenica TaxID=455432 RepID=A0A164H359_9NOCA|nr:hypothetical protein AWN90_09480 [Nocardia terpenica]